MSNQKRISPVKLVNITVKSQDGSSLFFRIRGDLPLRKPMIAYSDKKFLPYGSCHFVMDGERLALNKTPDELGLEDDDEIDALLPAGGGGRAPWRMHDLSSL